jgi:hypothetical protein
MAYKQNNPFSRKPSSPFNQENGTDELDALLEQYIKDKNLKIVKSSGEPQPITSYDGLPGESYTDINEPGGEGNRTAFIPTYENLIYDERGGEKLVGTSDSPSTQNVYETGERMVSDSLDLVNKGKNVAAAQVFGRDLSEELRQAKNIGEYDAVISKINRGHQDAENLKAAKNVADQGYSIGTDPMNPKLNLIDKSDPQLRRTYNQKLVDKFRERYNY